MHWKKRDISKAFTLFELMCVIVVAAIVAGVAIAMSGDSDSTAAMAGAEIVLQDLEYAQSEAIARRSEITVTYDVGAGTYAISSVSGTLTNPITKQAYVVNLSEETGSGGVSLSAADFGGSSSISFSSTGEPVIPGTDTPVSSSSFITVTCGNASRYVTITPVVGKISVN
jgi:prepilin-type N-terminal cleavage/methylation domain-containing protein